MLQRIIILLMIVGSVSFAQPIDSGFGYGYRGGNGGNHQMRRGNGRRDGSYLKEQLGLSDEQFAKLTELRKATAKKMKPLHNDIRRIRTEMVDNYKNDAKVKQLSKELGETHEQLSLLMVEQLKNIDSVLTPEQMKKFIELKEQRKAHKKGGIKASKQ